MTLKTVLITGCRGQVGDQLMRQFQGRCDHLVLTDQHVDTEVPDLIPLDLTDENQIVSLVRKIRPEVIINPAAYTAVDKAESQPSLATKMNANLPGILAREAATINALFVHYSTDYVFDGSGSQPRQENAAPNPLGIYGKTKLEGEKAIQSANPQHLIFRTSWVFSHHGQNFVKTMLKLGREKESLRIVADQIGAPTSAAFLARATFSAIHQVLKKPSLSGLYHLCSEGETSWYEFAVAIFTEARRLGSTLRVETVEPISSSEYPTPARRPLNSRLSCQKYEQAFGESRPTWQVSLSETLAHLCP